MPEYPSWRNYFDVVITGAAEAGLLPGARARSSAARTRRRACSARRSRLERGRIYEGGNLPDLRAAARHRRRPRALRRRPHLRRHPALEEELPVAHLHDRPGAGGGAGLAGAQQRSAGGARPARGAAGAARRRDRRCNAPALNVLDRRLERERRRRRTREQLEDERRRDEAELEALRRALRDADARIARARADASRRASTAYWGLTFKEGNENSRFGEQVEDYACLYTSRVSNFVFYSPDAVLPLAAGGHAARALRAGADLALGRRPRRAAGRGPALQGLQGGPLSVAIPVIH